MKGSVEDREPEEKAFGGLNGDDEMDFDINPTQASMRALIILLEGRKEAMTNPAIYHSFIGFDPAPVQACCQATAALGRDAVVAVFDPADVESGPKRIGISMDLGHLIRLQFGQLWMAKGDERAVIVPRGVGRRHGHYACESGRFVRRAGWPSDNLARGTERAEARLAELTIEFALSDA
ncbi:hypothetical protein HZF05_02920 [Sphingomonas sp. CGMCC 1.13654]|uniref:Uncharacterized protein n=1 Tax=Sphingomonas chungangi TaxID=2683589 RepID=A0A838L3E0_9SPHN|nr:hypothetical protein [Sphingomonas chungangi]MBA2933042.1 hypothetical protein [Sphingomonas chungangi]MVW56662.1 hypothetical protein [Sphingomonas chungangi]